MLLHAILLLLGSLAAAESVPPCDTSLIKGISRHDLEIDSNPPSGQVRVKCRWESDAIRFYAGPDNLRLNLYDSMACDASKGWTASMHPSNDSHYDTIANASEEVQIACHGTCERSIINRFNADEIKFSLDKTGKDGELSCVNRGNALVGIIAINGVGQRFEKFECTGSTWYSVPSRGQEHRGFDQIPSHLNFSCFEYCAVVSDSGFQNFEDDHFPARISKACKDSSQQIFFNGEKTSEDVIKCSMWTGWTHDNTIEGSSPWTPKHVECRSDSTQGGKRSVRAMRTAEGKQEE